jgi:hypothetical protein
MAKGLTMDLFTRLSAPEILDQVPNRLDSLCVPSLSHSLLFLPPPPPRARPHRSRRLCGLPRKCHTLGSACNVQGLRPTFRFGFPPLHIIPLDVAHTEPVCSLPAMYIQRPPRHLTGTYTSAPHNTPQHSQAERRRRILAVWACNHVLNAEAAGDEVSMNSPMTISSIRGSCPSICCGE